MSAMQALKLLLSLEGHWVLSIGRDVNTRSFWIDLAINEGGRVPICFNLNLGSNSRMGRRQFVYLHLFGRRWFKSLDKKNTG